MARPYARLRAELDIAGIDRAYLARKLLIGERTVTARWNGKYPWTLDEMYVIMDLIHWPFDRMHELFPPGGRDRISSKEEAS